MNALNSSGSGRSVSVVGNHDKAVTGELSIEIVQHRRYTGSGMDAVGDHKVEQGILDEESAIYRQRSMMRSSFTAPRTCRNISDIFLLRKMQREVFMRSIPGSVSSVTHTVPLSSARIV
jgi:hypothetical protein